MTGIALFCEFFLSGTFVILILGTKYENFSNVIPLFQTELT